MGARGGGGCTLAIGFNSGGKKIFQPLYRGGGEVNFVPCCTHFSNSLLIIIAQFINTSVNFLNKVSAIPNHQCKTPAILRAITN